MPFPFQVDANIISNAICLGNLSKVCQPRSEYVIETVHCIWQGILKSCRTDRVSLHSPRRVTCWSWLFENWIKSKNNSVYFVDIRDIIEDIFSTPPVQRLGGFKILGILEISLKSPILVKRSDMEVLVDLLIKYSNGAFRLIYDAGIVDFNGISTKKHSVHLLGFRIVINPIEMHRDLDPFRILTAQFRRYRNYGAMLHRRVIDNILAHKSLIRKSCSPMYRKCKLEFKLVSPAGGIYLKFLSRHFYKINCNSPITMVDDYSRDYITNLPSKIDVYKIWCMLITFVLFYWGRRLNIPEIIELLDKQFFGVLHKNNITIKTNIEYSGMDVRGYDLRLILNFPICKTIKQALVTKLDWHDLTPSERWIIRYYGIDLNILGKAKYLYDED